MRYLLILFLFYVNLTVAQQKDSIVYVHGRKMELLNTISGRISPKSVVSNDYGLFFAQNMMYKHTITVYNRRFELLKTIPDNIKLSKYGFANHTGSYRGAPVECTFSHEGKYAWVSNYEMTGGGSKEFSKPGCDACNSATKYDSSYVYKINTKTFEIEKVIVVGAVPKYMASTPDDKKILVSNWSSGDLSIIDTELNKEIKRIKLDAYPRGIVVDGQSKYAYIAIMGRKKVAKLNLANYTIEWLDNIGRNPRHLCLSPDDKTLYISLNGEGKIAKLDLNTRKIVKKSTGRLPRSMDISKDGKFLYVVNYGSNELTKLETETMKIIATSKTKSKPIGVTVDHRTKNVWTACYSGRIMVFHDTYYDSIPVNITERDALLAALAKEEEEKKATRKLKGEKHSRHSKKPIKNELIDGQFILVSGSFETSEGARRRVKELKRKGVKAKLYYNEKNNRNYAYIGSYSTRAEAVKASKSQVVDSWAFRLPKEAQLLASNVSSNKTEKKKENTVKENKNDKQESNSKETNKLPFLIVSGSFSSQSNAKVRVRILKKSFKNAFVYHNPTNGNFYAILGDFETKEAARVFLKGTSEDGWIFRRK